MQLHKLTAIKQEQAKVKEKLAPFTEIVTCVKAAVDAAEKYLAQIAYYHEQAKQLRFAIAYDLDASYQKKLDDLILKQPAIIDDRNEFPEDLKYTLERKALKTYEATVADVDFKIGLQPQKNNNEMPLPLKQAQESAPEQKPVTAPQVFTQAPHYTVRNSNVNSGTVRRKFYVRSRPKEKIKMPSEYRIKAFKLKLSAVITIVLLVLTAIGLYLAKKSGDPESGFWFTGFLPTLIPVPLLIFANHKDEKGERTPSEAASFMIAHYLHKRDVKKAKIHQAFQKRRKLKIKRQDLPQPNQATIDDDWTDF